MGNENNIILEVQQLILSLRFMILSSSDRREFKRIIGDGDIENKTDVELETIRKELFALLDNVRNGNKPENMKRMADKVIDSIEDAFMTVHPHLSEAIVKGIKRARVEIHNEISRGIVVTESLVTVMVKANIDYEIENIQPK